MGRSDVGLQVRGGLELLQEVEGGAQQLRALPHPLCALLLQPVRCTATA